MGHRTLVSHPNEEATYNLIDPLVTALWEAQHITHHLKASHCGSERGQLPVSRASASRELTSRSSAFHSLDKASVVWQNPHYDASKFSKPPNPHRRVDIIISPWKTVGFAVASWNSGTQFQRDMRVFGKEERGLKFDSSGVRRRSDGAWMDLEGAEAASVEAGVKGGMRNADRWDMVEAEKRVLEGLGMVWRGPRERCTPGA